VGRFDGKVTFVTGAGSGIGAATARRLGGEGATVACVDVNHETAEKTAAAIADAGGAASAFGCDVRDSVAVDGTMAAVVDQLGPPNVVCNVAGVGRFSHTHETTDEEWDRIIGINLTGTFNVCRAALPHLLANGGNIVNTASSAGKIGQPYSAAYCASKGGVVQLTKALAYEYIERGVRVNAVAPGGVETPIMNDFTILPEGASRKLLYKITSLMGFAQPEELAGLFAYIASDEARYMNGSIVSMDGGVTC
jgi:meso-butanediol dehydrogenase/(S,S)-butanediol dehydrogenase/diacetyl reductase